jgi:outer membrane protein assembly factor BamC
MKKLFKLYKLGIVFLLAILVVGCSSVTGGRKVDYKTAAVTDTLEVPPDLTSLPESRTNSGVTTYTGYAATQKIQQPTGAAVLPTFAKVEVKREAGERWLVVDEKPEKVWPQLREFLFSLGLSISRENKATGMIETDWAENQAAKTRGGSLSALFGWFRDTGVRDRYRIRVEKEPGSRRTEVYLTHQGLIEVVASGGGEDIVQTVWQPSGSDKELEREMLRLLMLHLGVEDAKARSMLTGGLGQARASLEFDGNDVADLRTNDTFNTAWRRVGQALDRMGVETTSKDRNKGIYTIEVIKPEDKDKKPGFFSRMMGKETIEPDVYRLKVTALKTGSQIRLLQDKKDRSVTTLGGKEFMKKLHEALR